MKPIRKQNLFAAAIACIAIGVGVPGRGTLYSTTVDVSGELIKDDEHAMKVIMARQ